MPDIQLQQRRLPHMWSSIAACASPVPISGSMGGNGHVDQQDLCNTALDHLKRWIRHREFPPTAICLWQLDFMIVLLQRIADSVQRSSADPQITHKGGELSINNQKSSPPFPPVEQYKMCMVSCAAVFLQAHLWCAGIPQAVSPERSEYAGLLQIGCDPRPTPHPGQRLLLHPADADAPLTLPDIIPAPKAMSR